MGEVHLAGSTLGPEECRALQGEGPRAPSTVPHRSRHEVGRLGGGSHLPERFQSASLLSQCDSRLILTRPADLRLRGTRRLRLYDARSCRQDEVGNQWSSSTSWGLFGRLSTCIHTREGELYGPPSMRADVDIDAFDSSRSWDSTASLSTSSTVPRQFLPTSATRSSCTVS